MKQTGNHLVLMFLTQTPKVVGRSIIVTGPLKTLKFPLAQQLRALDMVMSQKIKHPKLVLDIVSKLFKAFNQKCYFLVLPASMAAAFHDIMIPHGRGMIHAYKRQR